jgi:hypothetical protein
MERVCAHLAEIYGDEMSLTLARREGAAELRLQVPLLLEPPRGDPQPAHRPADLAGEPLRRGSASAPGLETSA